MITDLAINTRKIHRYKNAIYAVSLILIFAVSIAMAFAPTASAQVGITQPRQTYAYISVSPKLVGVGQQATVNLWVIPFPEDYGNVPYWEGFSGISVTFTKPDGTTQTLTPTDGTGTYPAGVTDALGSIYFFYAPSEAGNWSVTMSMPAQNFTDTTGTIQWTACTSQPASFTVQTTPVNAGLLNGYPWSPLPNSNVFWKTPVNSNNREWDAISGDWLTTPNSKLPDILNNGGDYNAYSTGISTAHILWQVQDAYGGIVGGDLKDVSYETTSTVSQSSEVPIVVDGMEFINMLGGANEFKCYDLTTGQLLYTATGQVSAGIDLPGNPYIQHSEHTGLSNVVLASSYGATPTAYLWQNAGTTWNYYDPLSGALLISLVNAPSTTSYGAQIEMIDGGALAYGWSLLNYNLTTTEYTTNYVWAWNYSAVSGTNWQTGLMWKTNVNSPGHPGPGDGSARTEFAMSSDMSTIVIGPGPGDNMMEGFNAKTGQSLWNVTLPYTNEIGGEDQIYGTNDFLTNDPSQSTYYCYSDLTGQLVWSTSNVGAYPWSTKTLFEACNDANNEYVCTPAGSVVALSLTTGKIVWTSTPVPSTEYSEGVLPCYEWILEAGGYLYTYLGYSLGYEINPIPRFAEMICLNATTGATVWTLNGGVIPTAIADGYLMGTGINDGYYYTFGKGQSSTSVSVQNNVISKGNNVLITGNVLDESPAQPGTPAVSDSSMSEWMDYLHFQNATLLNSGYTPQGVQVTLTALDPNNNTENIGTYTTDGQGNFYVNWTPPVPGQYTITATFAGTGSYWPSSAETGIVVNPAAAAVTTTTTTVVSSGVSSTTLYEAIAAVIVVIIVVAIVLAVLMLRKRP